MAFIFVENGGIGKGWEPEDNSGSLKQSSGNVLWNRSLLNAPNRQLN